MANVANLTANSTLTTDFDVTPYYDDFDRYKNYYRLLFKPGYAVQARELTQIQSMLQNQIYQFGSHVFDYGSKVLLGAHTLYANTSKNPIPYVKIRDTDSSNNTVDIQDFIGQRVTGLSTYINATITDVLDGVESGSNTKTIYVKYESASNVNSSIRVFQSNEILTCNVGELLVLNTSPTGYGSKFAITEGVFFAKDHFLSFPAQSVVLDRYNPDPTCKVGFYITESIVNSSDDASLLDPALEASNYSAPGADRFKLNPTLQVLSFDDAVGPPEFVTLFTIKNGIIQQKYERPQYNILQQELAKRTYDESGDYYVKGMSIQVREHDDNGSNFGKYANGNTDLLFVGVEPGTSYVRGFEVNTYDTTELQTDKSFDYANVNAQIVTAGMGSYITVNEFVGTWELDKGTSVNLYDVAQNRLSDGLWSTGAATGNVIGTAAIHSIEYVSGAPGYNATYDVYLGDIKMIGSNTFSSVKSLYYNNSGYSDLGADVVLDTATGTAILKDSANYPLLYNTGSDYTRKIRLNTDESLTDMTYLFYRTSGISTPVTLAGNGQFSVTLSGGIETFPYGTVSDLSDSNKKNDIIVSLNETFNIALPGTVTANSGVGNTTTLTGSSTFFTRLNVGDKIEISGKSNTWFVTAIGGDTTLTVDKTLPSGISASSVWKAYKTGDILDFSLKGVDSGTDRTISATSTSLTFDPKETDLASKTVTVTYKVSRNAALEVPKNLNPNRYVKINCNSHPATTTGPFSLGFSDVYRVRKIVKKTGSMPTTLTDGTDVTNSFIIDNGQRDTSYDLASIKPKITLSSTDCLLVELDYFSPDFTSKAGYFSIDSYPVDDTSTANNKIRTETIPTYKSTTTGFNYDLRNHIDFRPIKTGTATDSITIAGASTNPSSTSTYSLPASGLRMPVPATTVNFDYSYYLGRIDLVCVNQEGTFTIIRGIPSANPLTPTNIPDNSMVLAIIEIPPYPSLSPAYAQTLNKKNLATKVRKVASVRHTMRDIGVLKNRIENLEYYAQLTLLEKAASDLTITDENGLDRFKNGIFVDTFNDHTLGATQLSDYRIVVDPVEKSIRPLYSTKVFGFDLVANTNTVMNNNMITLPFTEQVMFSQNNVTTIRNIERTSYLYIGRLSLLPSEDIWIDTEFAPDENLYVNGATISNEPNDPGSPTGNVRIIETTWEAWKKYVTGYSVYKGTGANKVLVGTYATKAQADSVAAQFRTQTDVTIETIYNNKRVGTQLFATEFADSATSGYKVIDVSEIPYIRPQTIYATARGLKPYSKLYTFFDNEDITSYVTPLSATQFDALTDDNPATIATGLLSEGSSMTVSANGDVTFAMRLSDQKKFQTGTKTVLITDSPTNAEDDASTGALAYFTAAGLKVVKQKTVYSTKNEIINQRDVEENYASSNFEVIPKQVNSCFDPNALVTMSDGSKKRIADIVIGDKVLSGNNNDINTVLGIEEVALANRKMYKFNNTWAFVSEEHPILTDKGWSAFNPNSWAVEEEFVGKLAQIDIGTKVAKFDGSFETIENIESIEKEESYLIYNLMLDGDHTYIVEDYVVHNKKSCLAYSFLAQAPKGEEGIFLSSVDVFISQKDADLGIWFEIREMDDAGGITRTQVPMSEVWYESSQVPISTDGLTNPLTVRFKSPIFLYNNTQYAFVIHTENISPNYYLWVSRLGQTDVNTGLPVNSRALTGTFYTTNNNLNWDIVPDVDLRCVFRRASFSTNINGTAVLGNKPVEKMIFNSVSKSLKGSVGDVYTSGDRIGITGSNGTFSLGDVIIGANSGINTFITSVTSASEIIGANRGFQVGELVSAYYSSNLNYKGITATVVSANSAIATLSDYEENSKQITGIFIKSNGKFKANDIIKSTRDSSFTANLNTIQNFRYSVSSFEPSYLKFNATDVRFAMKGYSNTGSIDSSYTTIMPEETYYHSTEKALFSRSNEVASLSNNRSSNVVVTMSTASQYVSPLLDLEKTSMIYVDNIINGNTLNESQATYGHLNNKYISKTITLAEGQDAEDVRVVITAYRPPTTDVKVWIRILNAQDSDPFVQRGWIELQRTAEADATYSSISNREDFREYTYTVPTANSNTETGIVTYTNSNGINFQGYKYFAVKVGLLNEENNSAIVPRVADLRVIALQM